MYDLACNVLTGNRIANTITDLHSGKISWGWKPCGAFLNRWTGAIPQRSAPSSFAIFLYQLHSY